MYVFTQYPAVIVDEYGDKGTPTANAATGYEWGTFNRFPPPRRFYMYRTVSQRTLRVA